LKKAKPAGRATLGRQCRIVRVGRAIQRKSEKRTKKWHGQPVAQGTVVPPMWRWHDQPVPQGTVVPPMQKWHGHATAVLVRPDFKKWVFVLVWGG